MLPVPYAFRRVSLAPQKLMAARMTDRLITVAEFADRFGVGKSTVYREHNAGRLPFTKVGRATRIAESDAEAWLDGLHRH